MSKTPRCLALVLLPLACLASFAQEARLTRAETVSLPTQTDGNCPSFWLQDRLHLFSSIGHPLKISKWDPARQTWDSANVRVGPLANLAIWIEAAWVDGDGVVFGWYHHEPAALHAEWNLTAPKIGAVISFDGGDTIHDLGFVLESGEPLDPEAKNGAFLGGHGDFSVVLDREREYFYFFFTNYGGAQETQGICVARLAFADRFEPAGKVQKYHDGAWNEPGRGGRVTPIFPAVRNWRHADPDSFWGPAVHWNTHLNCFVMLLNRAQGEPGWTQEGIYISYLAALDRPQAWKPPVKLMDSAEFPAWGTWYPQVMGLEPGGTDTLAGATARFYLAGSSSWLIDFISEADLPAKNPGEAVPAPRPIPSDPFITP